MNIKIVTSFRVLVAFLAASLSLAAASSSISTVAGTGEKGFSGDGGPADRARLDNPYGIARGPDGGLYICDMGNNRVRRISPDGMIETVAGTGAPGYSGDGGPALSASLHEPYEVRFDHAGNIFFVEMKNNLVRRVDARTRVISTVAGTGKPGFSGDGGPATRAQFNQPHSIQFDAHGDLYICDIANHRIRRVDMRTGLISTFAGTGEKKPTPDGARIVGAPIFGPRAIDFDKAGNLWLALREGNAIYRFDLQAGTVHRMAGSGAKGFSGNGGPALQAALSGPKGISVAPDGNVYFTDTESHSVRLIDLRKGTVEVVAGLEQKGDGPEGNPLTCKLSRPHGVFVDADGSVFVGDSEAYRVQVVRFHP